MSFLPHPTLALTKLCWRFTYVLLREAVCHPLFDLWPHRHVVRPVTRHDAISHRDLHTSLLYVTLIYTTSKHCTIATVASSTLLPSSTGIYNILTNSVCYSAASIGMQNTWHSNIVQHHCHGLLTHQLSACQSCDIQCAVADSSPVDCYRWLSELFVLANGQESGTCAAQSTKTPPPEHYVCR